MAKREIVVSKAEVVNDVADSVATAAKKEKPSFSQRLEEMSEKEKAVVKPTSKDLQVLDLSSMSKAEKKAKLKELNAQGVIHGWNGKEALIVTADFIEKKAAYLQEKAEK
jgi:hypothetical protein